MKSIIVLIVTAILLPVSTGIAAKPKKSAALPAELFSKYPAEVYRQYMAIDTEIRNGKNKYASGYDHLARRKQSVNVQACILDEDKDPLIVFARRTAALAKDLSASVPRNMVLSLQKLRGAVTAASQEDIAKRIALFADLMELRREIAFTNPLLNFDELLFIKRDWAKYNHMCDQFYGYNAPKSKGLFVLDKPFSNKPGVRNILKDSVCVNGQYKGKPLPEGGYLSPDLSYDGKTILFAFTEAQRKSVKTWIHLDKSNAGSFNYPAWTEKSCFHVFSVKTDGSELTQLTEGKFNDFDPCWMPNGRIVFISERRGGFLRCSGRRPCPNYTLYTMLPDGTDIVCISPHETHEWNPSINNSGMIIYTRWDYVDRGFNQAHHPWITTPDGRDARAIHGNYAKTDRDRPDMVMGLRAIPNSQKYIGVTAAHHGQHFGSLILIDTRIEDDNKMSQVARFTPETPFPECETGITVNATRYGTPYPLSEKYALCAYAPHGRGHGLYLADCFGNRVMLYTDKSGAIDPIPMRPRKVPPIVPQISHIGRPKNDPAPKVAPRDKGTAVMGVVNVYNSKYPFPKGVKIKGLRICRVILKTTPVHHAPQIGYGCETSARAVLGTVPVEEDGSAAFKLPSGVGVYFQALDENGLAVQSMRSETYGQPGETLVCNGCHESRNQAPARRSITLAMKRAPSEIKPEADGSNPFNFPRLVQPVLDRKCVTCHVKNMPKNKKVPDLRPGDYMKDKFRWYTSYRNLQPYAFFFGAKTQRGYDAWQPAETMPGKFGARASRLYAHLKKHHDLKLSTDERRRITLWLDLNSDFFGSCNDIDAQAAGKKVVPDENVFVFDLQQQENPQSSKK